MKVYKFSASWCGPCKQLSALIDTLEPKPDIIEVDIDDNIDMASRYQIRGVPTMVKVDSDGNVVDRVVGMQTKAKLEQWLSKETSNG